MLGATICLKGGGASATAIVSVLPPGGKGVTDALALTFGHSYRLTFVRETKGLVLCDRILLLCCAHLSSWVAKSSRAHYQRLCGEFSYTKHAVTHLRQRRESPGSWFLVKLEGQSCMEDRVCLFWDCSCSVACFLLPHWHVRHGAAFLCMSNQRSQCRNACPPRRVDAASPLCRFTDDGEVLRQTTHVSPLPLT